jgi:hypothetical protein
MALFFFTSIEAQKIAPGDIKALRKKEDSLKNLSKSLVIDSLTAQRMRKDSLFIRTLVRSLQIKNSFYYPFDSIQGVSKLYAPDSSFRIFTWSLSYDDYYSRQRGAIQLRTKDGSLKLVPLRDFSEFTAKPNDSLRNKDNWIGAVYYNIIKTEYKGKKYYTLFGFDNNSVRTTKKWIDVLTFNEKDQPLFGEAIFSFEKDSIKKPAIHRFHIEYKKEASTLVNYVPDEGLILVDHLISETDEDDKPYTFIPDGDYEGFKWQNGTWVHVDKVFNFKVDMKGVDPYLGNAPGGEPLIDKNGKRNEERLIEQSEKNKLKKKNND